MILSIIPWYLRLALHSTYFSMSASAILSKSISFHFVWTWADHALQLSNSEKLSMERNLNSLGVSEIVTSPIVMRMCSIFSTPVGKDISVLIVSGLLVNAMTARNVLSAAISCLPLQVSSSPRWTIAISRSLWSSWNCFPSVSISANSLCFIISTNV